MTINQFQELSSDTTGIDSIEPNWEALQGILEAEVLQFETIAQKLTLKKESLLASKPRQMVQLDQELLVLSRKSQQLEQQRQDTLAAAGYDHCTLSQVIAQLSKTEPKRSNRLSQTREQLLRAVNNTRALNEENRELLAISLNWIQSTVELIVEALNPDCASYTAQGQKSKAGKLDSASQSALKTTINHSV